MKIKSYAKINLALDVLGVREDGYHRLETVMQKTGLADDITIRWQGELGGQRMAAKPETEAQPALEICLNPGKPYLPSGDKNLAYRAAMLMAEKAGANGRLTIDIEKNVPVAAGLGGGSANAAAVIVALNKLWKMRLNTWQLCELGEKLGADVPFLVLVHNTRYRCAFCEETGEKLTALRHGLRKHIVLAKPSFGVSTKEVFTGLDSCEIHARPDMQALIEGLKTEEDDRILPAMANVLEEYTLAHYSRVRELKEKMQSTEGARQVLMSGSGPTVFAIYDTYAEAKSACLSLRKQGYEAYWTQTIRDTEYRRK